VWRRCYSVRIPKQAEIDYLKRLGEAGAEHARHKPFSDVHRGQYLMDLGAVLSVIPPPPGRLLDLGVGTGWTSVFFARCGYEVVGQDISPDMVAVAESNAAAAGTDVRFVVSDYEQLDVGCGFDVAVFYDCLHHSENERDALSSAYRSLRPGGVCITVEPGRGHSKSPDSLRAIREFGVDERDMPPKLIIEAARSVGFSGAEVFLRPTKPMRAGTGALKNSAKDWARSMVAFVPRRAMSVGNIVMLTK
jgi:SAM-dependent methyltransferase